MLNLFISLFCLAHSLFSPMADPYLWLEEESEKQKEWVAGRKEESRAFFSQLPDIEEIELTLQRIVDYEARGLPEKQGEKLYYFVQYRNEDRQVLVEKSGEHERVLVNPNHLEPGAQLVGFSLSPTGKHIAYGLSFAGSDKMIWQLLDLETKECLADSLSGIKFSDPAWDINGTSLFYIKDCRYLYCHLVGRQNEEDELIYESAEGCFLIDPTPLKNGRELMVVEKPLAEKHGRILLIELWGICTPPYNVWELAPAGEVEMSFVDEANGELLFITDEKCSFGKLISLSRDGKKTLVNERRCVLEDALVVGDYLVCLYYHAACADLVLFDLKGKEMGKLPLPGKGSAALKKIRKATDEFYYSYFDFKTPPRGYIYHLDSQSSSPLFEQELNFDPAQFVTSQVWYSSKDGTVVPLFLTHKKELEISEKTPVLLFGYGGFALSLTPFFCPEFLAWMAEGGVLAVPSLRGGKEFGKGWHEQGRGLQKQNVFDDAIAAAEWLNAHHIGSSKTLAIFGTSNGGLLAGACLTQRPDLFRAAIVNKGVLDMLRFHLFTIGKFFMSDYGNPENPKDYANLFSYSPYHQIKAGTAYPAVLVNTADHDDRVVPLHSYKFASALKEANASGRPVLLRVEENCGHGGGSSTSQKIAFGRDMIAFLRSAMRTD